jgi:hypothetical protein
MTATIDKRKEDLNQELQKDIADARLNARMNHLTSVGLMIVALLCSVAAAAVGIIGASAASSRVAGVLAIMPPLIAFVVANLKIDGKACWYFNKVNALDRLRIRLLYELPETPSVDNIAAIAHDRSEVVDKMEKSWDTQLVLDWSTLSKPAHVMDINRAGASDRP